MLFEFAPTGNARVKHEVNAWDISMFDSVAASSSWGSILGHLVIPWALIAFNIGWLGWHLSWNGMKFFGFAWNWFDMVTLTLFILHYVFRVTAYMNVSAEPN